jgi:L-rhamnose mutarotase
MQPLGNMALHLGGSSSAAAAKPLNGAAAQKQTWTPQQFTGGGCPSTTGTRRICFEMRFDASDLEGCLAAHKNVWPEMQQALEQCGWHNYSLFYRPDGLAIGYYETQHVSHEAALEAMRKTEVSEVMRILHATATLPYY